MCVAAVLPFVSSSVAHDEPALEPLRIQVVISRDGARVANVTWLTR
jgi:hypothetical protein